MLKILEICNLISSYYVIPWHSVSFTCVVSHFLVAITPEKELNNLLLFHFIVHIVAFDGVSGVQNLLKEQYLVFSFQCLLLFVVFPFFYVYAMKLRKGLRKQMDFEGFEQQLSRYFLRCAKILFVQIYFIVVSISCLNNTNIDEEQNEQKCSKIVIANDMIGTSLVGLFAVDTIFTDLAGKELVDVIRLKLSKYEMWGFLLISVSLAISLFSFANSRVIENFSLSLQTVSSESTTYIVFYLLWVVGAVMISKDQNFDAPKRILKHSSIQEMRQSASESISSTNSPRIGRESSYARGEEIMLNVLV